MQGQTAGRPAMKDEKRLAVREFTHWSKGYDRSILQWLLFSPSHQALIKRIREVAGDRPTRLLDVGCGTGVFAALVRSTLPNVQVWGIDLVGGMLEKGRARWQEHRGRVLPVQGDSENLPFETGVFDLVTCANSFHHYPRQDRAVQEMARVLRPGGRLLLIDGYRDNIWGWFIYDVCVSTVEQCVHHASAGRFRALFSDAGLGSVVQHVHHGPAPFILNEGIAPAGVPRPHFGGLRVATSRPSIDEVGRGD